MDNKTKRLSVIILGWLTIAQTFVASIAIRFNYPELTETQLFVEFWYVWVICVALSIAGYGLIILGKDKYKTIKHDFGESIL